MAIQYTPIGWVIDSTALSASNFNHMEEGIVNSVNAVNNILDGETTFSGLKRFDTSIIAPGFSAQDDTSEQRGISYEANYILKFNYGDEFLEAYFNLPDKPSGEYTLATLDDISSKLYVHIIYNVNDDSYIRIISKRSEEYIKQELEMGLQVGENGILSLTLSDEVHNTAYICYRIELDGGYNEIHGCESGDDMSQPSITLTGFSNLEYDYSIEPF